MEKSKVPQTSVDTSLSKPVGLRELGRKLKRGHAQLHRLASDPGFPSTTVNGKRLFIPADVAKWMEHNTRLRKPLKLEASSSTLPATGVARMSDDELEQSHQQLLKYQQEVVTVAEGLLIATADQIADIPENTGIAAVEWLAMEPTILKQLTADDFKSLAGAINAAVMYLCACAALEQGEPLKLNATREYYDDLIEPQFGDPFNRVVELAYRCWVAGRFPGRDAGEISITPAVD